MTQIDQAKIDNVVANSVTMVYFWGGFKPFGSFYEP
jgi:hypothetical protein